jgi:hypothetical protein
MILFVKLAQHQPLNRRALCREGIGLSLSMLAAGIGTGARRRPMRA